MSKAARLLKAEGVRVAARVEPPNGAAGDPVAGAANGGGGPPGHGHGLAGLPESAPFAGESGPGRPGGWQLARWHLRLQGAALASARERARRIVGRARQKARDIQSRARQEGFEAGYRDGLQQGHSAAQAEARARVEQILAQLQQVVQEAEQRRERALMQAEADVVQLALAVAEKVVRRQVESGPEVTRAVLRELLGQGLAGSPSRVRVRVHPEELALLEGEGRETAPAQVGPVQVEWVADPRIRRGGCVVETDLGAIDADLNTRLGLVRQALMDGLRDGSP